MFLEVISGLVICLFGFVWWWQRSSKIYWDKNNVSYVPGPPITGIMMDPLRSKRGFFEVFSDLYNHSDFKNDPITGFYAFHKPSLLIRHPEIIKNILVRDFSSFVNRNMGCDPHDIIGSENLFLAKDNLWKALRNRLSPVYTSGKLKNLFLLLVDVSKVLEEKLTIEIGQVSKEYDTKEFASLFITDAIAITAFGVKANSLLGSKGDFHKNVMRSFRSDTKRSLQFCICVFLPKLAEMLQIKFFSNETNKFMRSTISHVIEEREKSGMKRNDVIDVLISMKNENSDLFKSDTLVGQAAAFLFAGYESSKNALSFILYQLAQRPKIQDKLRKEIQDYLEKYDSVQYETINEMDYLHCVIQESIRMNQTLPFMHRVCSPSDGTDSYSLKPYHNFAIPKGMIVYIPHAAIHKDPKYYPEPLEFNPERFSGKKRESIDQYVNLLFGRGPRDCIGSRFAYLQIKMALITIVSKYRLEPTARTPETFVRNEKSLLSKAKEHLYVNFVKI